MDHITIIISFILIIFYIVNIFINVKTKLKLGKNLLDTFNIFFGFLAVYYFPIQYMVNNSFSYTLIIIAFIVYGFYLYLLHVKFFTYKIYKKNLDRFLENKFDPKKDLPNLF